MISVCGPGGHADDGTSREKIIEDRNTFGWHDALIGKAKGRVEAAGFFDACVQVWEGEGLLPGYEFGVQTRCG